MEVAKNPTRWLIAQPSSPGNSACQWSGKRTRLEGLGKTTLERRQAPVPSGGAEGSAVNARTPYGASLMGHLRDHAETAKCVPAFE
jgi:hypothetical protein